MSHTITLRHLHASLFALGALLFTGGCAVASYEKPVNDMAGAVSDSITSIEKIDARLTAAQNRRLRNGLLNKSVILETASGSCALGSPGCYLEFAYMDGGRLVQGRFPVVSVIPKARAGLDGLKSYVANLQSIVAADTASEVAASANGALASLLVIEKSVEEAGGPKARVIAGFGESGADAISWLVGQYVDSVKVRALRNATTEAEPVITSLAAFYDDIAKAESLIGLAESHRKFIGVQGRFGDGAVVDDATIDAYVSEAAAYDGALRAVASRPLQAFTEAHTKLAGHLRGEDISMAEARAAIQDLVARAQLFKAIADRIAAESTVTP